MFRPDNWETKYFEPGLLLGCSWVTAGLQLGSAGLQLCYSWVVTWLWGYSFIVFVTLTHHGSAVGSQQNSPTLQVKQTALSTEFGYVRASD